ncbi:MAG TPA: glycosyltransferase family 9 protein [Bacteroidota bacterium]|nr:glycosyltransferase family 9 protein [Bacteroidota bacterium]
MTPHPHTVPGRICLVAEGQLGDLIILTPAIRALRASFPRALIALLVLHRRRYATGSPPGPIVREDSRGGTAEVLRSDPGVDRIAEIDRDALRALKGVARLRAELGVVRWMRGMRFDTVVCTFPQDRFFLWAFLSGARRRVGEGGRPLSFLLTSRTGAHRGKGGVLDYYCALAGAAGAPVTDRATAVTIPPAHRRRADETWRSVRGRLRGRVVAVHPGASGDYRVWPPESYGKLIDRLQGEGISVLLAGSDFDRSVVLDVERRCARAVPSIFTNDVLDLAALLEKCALLVSNNSGPRHLAVACGVPSLALIPRFDDIGWKIYDDEVRAGTLQSSAPCPACPADSCRNAVPPGERYGSYCMRALGAEDVAARVLWLLGRLPGGRSRGATGVSPLPPRRPAYGSGRRSPAANRSKRRGSR